MPKVTTSPYKLHRFSRHTQESPKKQRQRAKDSDAVDWPLKQTSSSKILPAARDSVFFKEAPDAVCYIRVQDVIFKIHSQVLQCCQSLAQLLHERVTTHRPTTEQEPLFLVRPSVDEFRALLWAWYSTEDELAGPPEEQDYVNRLLLIASITQKYEIPRLYEWVVARIHSTACNDVFMESCSSSSLGNLAETCINCNWTNILNVVVDKWCARLECKGTPSVPAIQVADKYQLVLLRGTAYYVHIQDTVDRQGTHADNGGLLLRTDPKLSYGQVLCLLTGYWSLVSLWDHLKIHPIHLPETLECSGEPHARCTTSWYRRWTFAAGQKRILRINSADILGLLDCLRDQLTNDEDLKAGTNSQCRSAGLQALRALQARTKEGLPQHFSGLA